MKYLNHNLLDILSNHGVKAGDTVCVSSDIAAMGIPPEFKKAILSSGVEILFDSYIETLKYMVGDCGTIIMPTFTYSACKGEVFDVQSSKSTVGALTERFRLSDNTIRSEHPIFSFSAWGEKAGSLMGKQGYDSFGPNSLYDLLFQSNALYLMLGVHLWQGATYVYYSEQKYNVPYRYLKTFDGSVKTTESNSYNTQVDYFVRNYDWNYADSWQTLESEAIEAGILTCSEYNTAPIISHRAQPFDEFIGKKLAENSNYLIRFLD